MLSLGVACDGGNSGPSRDATPPADAGAIRDVDVGQQGDVRALLSRLGGGSIAEKEIEYADLTGDGREEAIVPITSGGTMGNIAYAVLGPENGGAVLLLTRTLGPRDPGGLMLAVEGGKLVEYVGEYGPEDPFCCPSILRKTTFRWDGARFQAEGEQRVPAGQRKD